MNELYTKYAKKQNYVNHVFRDVVKLTTFHKDNRRLIMLCCVDLIHSRKDDINMTMLHNITLILHLENFERWQWQVVETGEWTSPLPADPVRRHQWTACLLLSERQEGGDETFSLFLDIVITYCCIRERFVFWSLFLISPFLGTEVSCQCSFPTPETN